MPRPFPSAPRDWLFNDDDREAHQDRFWAFPVRLVTDGTWAELWRADESCRGGGTCSSVLPVLALHTWVGKRSIYGADASGLHTPWCFLSTRRIARLAGVHVDTVAKVFARLEQLELLQRQRIPAPKHQGGPPRRLYRLAKTLYPEGEQDRHARLPGTVFYGGAWSMLPTASARHLYVALHALDPVLDEESYTAARAESGLERAEMLAEARGRHPLSLGQLARATGLRRSTVQEALDVLRRPIFDAGKLALIDSGETSSQSSWYAPNRWATTWHWGADFLNQPAKVRATQGQLWPVFGERRASADRKRRDAEWRADSRRRSNAGKKAAATRRRREAARLNGHHPPDVKDMPQDMQPDMQPDQGAR
ncbi:MAG: hypothetical protein AB7R55_14715 [Gemmatimonadales bacterium]